MISLFIDTYSSLVSISIIRDNKILAKKEENIPNKHSIYATSYVKKVMEEAAIDANMVDNIMVVNGPGSFTGVRIGVTIAKTYGYLINKEITPVSSLKCLAISSDHDGLVMSVIPANKNSYYVGIYDSEYNDIIDECCADSDKLYELIKKYNPYLVSNSFNVIGKHKVVLVNFSLLKIVNYYLNKEKVNYFKIVPNYLKLPQALEDKK